VQRLLIDFRVNTDRGDVQIPAGPDNPDGDLSTICNENLLERLAPDSFPLTLGRDRLTAKLWSFLSDVSMVRLFVRFLHAERERDAFLCVRSALLFFYNGIFPCFLGGLVSRLLAVISRARMSFGRVSFGSIISSM